MAPNSNQLSALTRLFSSAVFQELAKKGRSPLFARLVALTDIAAQAPADSTVGCAFDMAFARLRIAGQRDEYIYRTALAHKVLMGKHSLRTASMLNEFRAGTSKADLVILNGTATVYEIKSERDSLTRLAVQIENYRRVFGSVNVIAGENHINGVLGVIPGDVGVMCLSRRYQISTVREPLDRPDRICPMSVFESLRSAEAADILNALGVVLPKLPNIQRHAAMRERFAELPSKEVHSHMVRVLKRTRSLASLEILVEKLPRSMHAAALSVPIRRGDRERLIKSVATPLCSALDWD